MPHYISPSHLMRQYVCGPYQLKNSKCWDPGREFSLLLPPHTLLNILPARGKAGPQSPGLSEMSKNLAVPSCMGLSEEYAAVGWLVLRC